MRHIQPHDWRQSQAPRLHHWLIILALAGLLGVVTALPAAAEMIRAKSDHDFATTIDRLEAAIASREMTIFAVIDHAEAARDVGLELRPTRLTIFGNPKIGTGMMENHQEMGVVLPIRVLTWQDGDGAVWLGFESLIASGTGLGIAEDHPFLNGATKGMTGLINEVAEAGG